MKLSLLSILLGLGMGSVQVYGLLKPAAAPQEEQPPLYLAASAQHFELYHRRGTIYPAFPKPPRNRP